MRWPMARFANCEFDAALQVIDAILALPQGYQWSNCPGQRNSGCHRDLPRRLRAGPSASPRGEPNKRACSPPSTMHRYCSIWVAMAALGIGHADELVDDVREALRRAESFGDISGIVVAQCAYGTALLRAKNASHDEAIDVLRTRSVEHPEAQGDRTIALATIEPIWRSMPPAKGERDEAIKELRDSFRYTWAAASTLRRCPGEALVELLIDRAIHRRPRRGAPNCRRVAGPAARHSRAGPVVAEVTRVVGQGGRQLRRLRQAGQPIPRAVREARRPRPARRSASNGHG